MVLSNALVPRALTIVLLGALGACSGNDTSSESDAARTSDADGVADADVGGGGDAGPQTACSDGEGFSWTEQALVAPEGALTDALTAEVGLDDASRAHLIMQRGNGSLKRVSFSHFTTSQGWSAVSTVVDNAMASSGWGQHLAVNGAGDGIASYRQASNNAASLSDVRLADDGSRTQPVAYNTDNQSGTPQVAISEQGDTLVVFSAFDTDRHKVFSRVNGGAPTVSLEAASNVTTVQLSTAANGAGFLFVSAQSGADFGLRALPYDVAGGFGPAEDVTPAGVSVTNGQGGVHLGNGRAVAAYGFRPAPGQSVQLAMVFRSSDGQWSSPLRFDNGDGSEHARLLWIVEGGPDAAFVGWSLPSSGLYVARISEDGVSDERFLGLDGVVLASNPCGDAILAESDVSEQTVRVRHYRVGQGWDQTATALPGAFAGVDLAYSANGEAMLITSGSGRYYYSHLRAP